MTSTILRTLILALTLGAASVAAKEGPVAVITEAMEELAEGLDGRKEALTVDREALHALINDILLPRFDRTYAAQLVMGRHWRSADEEQRDRFIEAFYQNLLRKYADGVLEFDQDRIDIKPYRGDPSEKRTRVQTVVTLEDGTLVPVSYSLINRESGWQLFDVTIEGISYIRNFRSELNSEIGSKGLEAVITRLESEAEPESEQ
ncbi:MAG: ABC transporter substrate-binding protein [Woeseia sp.]